MHLRHWLEGFYPNPSLRISSRRRRISWQPEPLESRTLLSASTFVYLDNTQNPLFGIDAGSRSHPAFADLDADGDADLVVGVSGTTFLYYKNVGTATTPSFTLQSGASNPFNGWALASSRYAPVLADLDHDGDFDLISGKSDGSFAYFRNDGSPTSPLFSLQTGAADPLNGLKAFSGSSSPALADLDNDGDLDFVAGDSSGTLTTFWNTGNATAPAFTKVTGSADPFNPLSSSREIVPAFVDLDGDGDFDLLGGDQIGGIALSENTGTSLAPLFTPEHQTLLIGTALAPNANAAPVLVDLDGDGQLDMVCGKFDGTFDVYRQLNASLQFTQSADHSIVSVGDQVTFTLTVTNTGAFDLASVVISAPIPNGLSNPTVTPGVGTHANSLWTIPTLPHSSGTNSVSLTISGTLQPLPAGINLRSAAVWADAKVKLPATTQLTFAPLQSQLDVAVTNSAPTITDNSTVPLGTLLNAATVNTGVSIRDLVASTSLGDADPNPNAAQGIAVSGMDGTHGTWQFSLNDGATWTNIGTLAPDTARLLAADAATRIRLLPDSGALGQDSFSFYAWDQTDGLNGNIINAGSAVRGNTSSLSTQSATATLILSSSNNAPVLNPSGSPALNFQTLNQAPQLDRGDLVRDLIARMIPGGVTDSPGLYTRTGIAVVNSSAQNIIYSLDDGATWYDIDTPAGFARLLPADSRARIRFTPPAHFTGSYPEFFTFYAWDQTAGSIGGLLSTAVTGGSSSLSALTETASIVIQPSYVSSTGHPSSAPSFNLITDASNPFSAIAGGANSAPAFADLDGDHDLDLVVGGGDGMFDYFENVGSASSPVFVDRTWTTNPFKGFTVSRNSSPAFLDLDADGDLDMISGGQNGTLYEFKNVGSPSAPQFVPQLYAANPFYGIDVGAESIPAFADLDGDGDQDLYIGAANSITLKHYYKNTGTPQSPAFTLQSAADNPFLEVYGNNSVAPVFVDLNGDKLLDFMYGDNQRYFLYRSNVGTASAPLYSANYAGPFFSITPNGHSYPAFADIDGDGDLDLLNGADDGKIHFYRNSVSDLELSQSQSTDSSIRIPGSTLNITVTLTNRGTDPTANISVADAIPANLNNVTVTPSAGTYLNGVWTIPSLSAKPGENTVYLVISGTVGNGPTVTNSAEITASDDVDSDSVPNNHRAIEDDQTTLSISTPNAAPVLNNAGNPTFPTLDNDTEVLSNTGLLITELIAAMTPGGISDSDPGAAKGIALDTADNAQGTWQYSLDSGSHWSDVGSVAMSNALLLAANNQTRLRFIPSASFSGTATIGFSAWDQTSGLNGTTADTTNPTFTTSFSADHETASVNVAFINDAPVLVNSGSPSLTTILEDLSPATNAGTLVSQILVNFIASGGSLTDPDFNPLQGIAVNSADQANGTWQFSIDDGAHWTPFGAPSPFASRLLAADAATRVRFLPNHNYNGQATFSFAAWDQTDKTNGATTATVNRGYTLPFSDVIALASITVTSVNDAAPLLNTTGNPALPSIPEDTFNSTGTSIQDLIASGGAGYISDVDPADPKGIALYSAPSSGGNWQYSLNNGANWTTISGVSQTNALLLGADAAGNTRLRFVPLTNFNGTRKVYFRAWDQSSGTNGGFANITTNGGTTAFSYKADSATITVTPVNDAPLLFNTYNPVVPTVNKSAVNNLGFKVSNMIASVSPNEYITDADGGVEGIAIYAVQDVGGHWEYSLDNTATWTSIGAVAANNALLLKSDASTYLRFVPNNTTTGDRKIFFRAWDQSTGVAGTKVDATATGGTNPFSVGADSVTLTVNTVNDAPVLNPAGSPTLPTIPKTNNNPAGISILDLIASGGANYITDLESTDPQGIAIYGAPSSGGTWEYSLDSGAHWTGVGTVDQSNSLLLKAVASTLIRFRPNGSFTGVRSISFAAWDQSTGTEATKVDTNTRGGTTAFSLARDTASVTVN